MQLLCLLIFIGATQCDESSESKTLEPTSYENLEVPNAQEFVSQYQLSVQTSYVTSVECMLSSNYYIQSGFSEIDSSSNDLATNLMTKFKDGFGSIRNMILGLQQTDYEKESQDKINAVVSMTVNYYQKKNVVVEKSETKLSEVTEVQQAQSILTAKRCESSYSNFMNDVTTIKSKYTSETCSTSTINMNQWATLVKQYNDARESIVMQTNVYSSIRDAFMLGSKINLCEGSANTDQSLLDIYKTDDLSKYFGKTDNDTSALLCQTVTQMYTIYKASLTNIYLKSVVHSYSDLAMRITIWEQVNLVRANFEYMSQNIVFLIKTAQSDAESKFHVDSEENEKIKISLYACVNEMLLTAVKSTEVHYKRGLNFNQDRSMITTDFNQYKEDIIEKYYEDNILSNPFIARYDMRLVEKKFSQSSQMSILQNTYPLVINKLVFQTFICQVNYINLRMQSTKYDETTVDFWIHEKITMIQFQNSIIFSKFTATINKIFIMNCATYTYILLTTDQSAQSTDVQQIMEQSSNDVIGILCVNTLEITETFNTIDIFIDTNCNSNTKSVVYKPDKPRNSYTPPNNGGGSPLNGGGSSPNSGNYSQPGSSSPNSETPTKGRTPPSGTYYPQLGSPTSKDVGNGNSFDIEYSYITSGVQIIKTVQLLQSSFSSKITSSLTTVKNKPETEYTKVVIQSLEICQKISEYNTEYLDSVVSDSIKYVSEVTTSDSQDYILALIVIFRDTNEKLRILTSTMEIPFKRANMYSLTSEEYVFVNQTIEYTEFVTTFYKHFGINRNEILNSENDADLFLTNSITQFNKIHETVFTAVQSTPEDSYKQFLLCYLQKTLDVYKHTTDCFREQIVQTTQYISQSGGNSKCAFYHEIVYRVDSIIVMFSGILIKSYQYSKNTSSVTIYESELDIVTMQTEIVSSYTTFIVEHTVEIEVEVIH